MAVVKKKSGDSWKLKSWYTIVAPKFLNEAQIGSMPALDDDHMLNRIIIFPLKDITRNLMHLNTNVKIRVETIKGKTAYTKFIGHEVSREYVRHMARKGRDVLDVVLATKSKDGAEFTVKAVVFTANKISDKQKRALHNALAQYLREKTRGTDMGQFVLDALWNKVSQEAAGVLKKIVPVSRVEIRATQLKEVFDTETIAAPKPENDETMQAAEDDFRGPRRRREKTQAEEYDERMKAERAAEVAESKAEGAKEGAQGDAADSTQEPQAETA